MPLFRRPDGDLVENESHVRRMIPYLMRGRNESVCYHEQIHDLTKTKPWLRAYNQSHKQPASLFHLLLNFIGRSFQARPGMNRFVSGGHIYQRKGVLLSFSAKKSFRDDSPLVTVKLPFNEHEPLERTVERIGEALGEGRSDKDRTVDKEVKLALALPGWLLSVVMGCLRWADRVNLMPGAMIANDPLYASAFVANLGSVGLDRTHHHLYEYGTISLFCVLGTPRKMVVVGSDGQPTVRDGVEVRWAFDERINDGFYCAQSLKLLQRMVEDPEKYMGPATGKSAEPPALSPSPST